MACAPHVEIVIKSMLYLLMPPLNNNVNQWTPLLMKNLMPVFKDLITDMKFIVV